jgi:hypothetical protein
MNTKLYKNDTILLTGLMGLHEDQYNEIVYDCGCQYIEQQCGGDAWGKEYLTSPESMFWFWWTNQWSIRNRSLIEIYGLDILNIESIDIATRHEVMAIFSENHLKAFKSNVLDRGYWNIAVKALNGKKISRKEAHHA